MFGDGLLLGAAFHKVRTWKKDDRPHALRARLMVREIVRHHGPLLDIVDEFLCEWPQIYKKKHGQKKNIDPNRLLPLPGVCVGVASHLPLDTVIESVLPKDWGAPGKPPRKSDDYVVETVCRSILSAGELANVPEKTEWDLWDAVAIGLWKLERLKWRTKPYPGT